MPRAYVLLHLPIDSRKHLERLIDQDTWCVWQPGYHRDREQAYRVDPSAMPTDHAGMADAEQRVFNWFNFCRFRLVQTLVEAQARPLSASLARRLVKYRVAALAMRERIVLAHRPLAWSVASKVAPRQQDREDYCQEAVGRLMRATDRFDCENGTAFSSYAFVAILRELITYRGQRTRHLGHEVCGLTAAAALIGLSDNGRRDAPLDEGLLDLSEILGANRAGLSVLEAGIISRRFGLGRDKPHTFRELAKGTSVTWSRMEQIEKRAVHKLKVAFGLEPPHAPRYC